MLSKWFRSFLLLVACAAGSALADEAQIWFNAGRPTAEARQAGDILLSAGKAIDIRLPGVPLSELRDVALSLRAGGVGYYPDDQFLHVDTGRVRSWQG